MMFDLSKLPIKDRVIKLIETSSNHSHRLTESGSSTYSESTPNQLLSHPDISMLKNIMQNCIDAYVAKAGIQRCSISNSWANMLGNGASVGIHRRIKRSQRSVLSLSTTRKYPANIAFSYSNV